ncbi:MAG: hypothetical protein RIR62_2349 [Pseudomonadota bacterium]
MTDPATADPGRWGDLRTRALSAVVMVAIGAVELWLGGLSFRILVVLLAGLMVWELATMTAPARRNTPKAMGAIAAAALAGAIWLPSDAAPALLLAPALALALTPRKDRRISSGYAVAIMVASFGLVQLRDAGGTLAIVWIVTVVVASDVLGYFAGRMIGGPKFWPAISPKKTWSGTLAGWIGAVLVAAGFVLAGQGGWLLLLLSPLVAFAGQMGDIAESWVKRRSGVKDASRLIPGHGGVLDRFDALIGALLAVIVIDLFLALPIG